MNRAAHQGPRIAGRALVPAVAWPASTIPDTAAAAATGVRPRPGRAINPRPPRPSRISGRRLAKPVRALDAHGRYPYLLAVPAASPPVHRPSAASRRPGLGAADLETRRQTRRGGGGCGCGGGEGIGGSRRSGPGYRRGIWRVGRCAAAHAEGTRRMRRSKRERLSLAESGLSEAMRRRTRPGRWWWWSQERGVWIERAAVGQMPQKSGDRILNGFSCPHLLVVRRRSWGAGSKGWPHGRGWRPTPSSCCAGRARGGRGER